MHQGCSSSAELPPIGSARRGLRDGSFSDHPRSALPLHFMDARPPEPAVGGVGLARATRPSMPPVTHAVQFTFLRMPLRVPSH